MTEHNDTTSISSQDEQDSLMNPMTGLHALHLGKTYGKRPILRDVSVQLQPGEAVG